MSVPAAEQMQQGGMIQHTLLPACPVLKICLVSIGTAHREKRAGESRGRFTLKTENSKDPHREYDAPIWLDQRKIRCQRCSQFDLGGKEREWSLIHHNEPQGTKGPQRPTKYRVTPQNSATRSEELIIGVVIISWKVATLPIFCSGPQ